MELAWCWQEGYLHLFPHSNSCISQLLEDLIETIWEIAWWKNCLNYWLENETYFIRQRHVHYEEVVLESIWYVVSSSTRMAHCSNKTKVLDVLEVSSFIFLKSIKTIVFDKLSDNLKCDLVAPFVLLWHWQIIYENGHFPTILWSETFSYLCLTNWLNWWLELKWQGCRREVYSMEQHFLGVEFLSIHEYWWGLCRAWGTS